MSRNRPAQRAAMCYVVAALTTLCFAPAAWAHAAYNSSEPEPGARLDEPPGEITVSYAEPPTNQSTFQVLDGCDRNVASFSVLNDTIEAEIGEAQPGRWRVEWSVVSAVDGHLTRDNFSFTVRGEPDCTQVAAPDGPDDSSGSDGSGPLVPIAIATAVIVAIGAGVRLATRSRTTREE